MPPHRDQLLTVTDVLHVTGFKSRTTLCRRAQRGLSLPLPYRRGQDPLALRRCRGLAE